MNIVLTGPNFNVKIVWEKFNTQIASEFFYTKHREKIVCNFNKVFIPIYAIKHSINTLEYLFNIK